MSRLRRLLGPKLPVGAAALHVCALCHGDFVNPTSWTDEAAGLWRVKLRCGACGHERETVLGVEASRIFNQALDQRRDCLQATAERVERESMVRWVETFTAALWHDLIDPADFGPTGSSR